MVNTDPVRIVVKLIDKVSQDLAKIQANLEKLDNQLIDPDFNIDDSGEISRLQARMKLLERDLRSKWELSVSKADLAKVASIREALGSNIGTNLGRMNIAGGISAVPDMGVFGAGAAMPAGKSRTRSRVIGKMNEGFANLGRTLVRYKPSIMDWWQVLALLIPIIITLVAAVVGLVAALGALATAAAGIIGIGLIGWGDSTAETMQNLRQEVGRLKEELFAAVQPAATQLQPITEGWMRGAPEQVARLNDELKNLAAFEEGLSAAGAGVIGWIEEAIDSMVSMRQEAVQVGLRMGSALGSSVINLMEFGLEELYQNQESYIKVAKAFAQILMVLFNLSRMVTFMVAQFQPFFRLVVKITDLMSNRWSIAILTAVTALAAMTFVLGNVAAVLTGITTVGFLSFLQGAISWVSSLTTQLWAMWGALSAIQKVVFSIAAATGVGLAFVAAGQALAASQGPRQGATGTAAGQAVGGNNVTNINVQGDMGEKEMHRVLDHLETKG